MHIRSFSSKCLKTKTESAQMKHEDETAVTLHRRNTLYSLRVSVIHKKAGADDLSITLEKNNDDSRSRGQEIEKLEKNKKVHWIQPEPARQDQDV